MLRLRAVPVCIVIFTLVGCGHAGDSAASTAAPGRAGGSPSVSNVTPSGAPSPSEEVVSGVPVPDTAHRRAFLQGLKLADPRLVQDPEAAVRAGRAGCVDMGEGRPGRVQIANMQQRFAAQVPDMLAVAAQAVLASARAYICPDV
ncbi:DUF732 domain-containing protein [Streptomyces sp. NPDC086549]|uniref:DUF732 domain-containing protein n=1 Tax=Streptomyces sp. NPDC086549 TaxID=3365752 RepID=UPI003814CC18